MDVRVIATSALPPRESTTAHAMTQLIHPVVLGVGRRLGGMSSRAIRPLPPPPPPPRRDMVVVRVEMERVLRD